MCLEYIITPYILCVSDIYALSSTSCHQDRSLFQLHLSMDLPNVKFTCPVGVTFDKIKGKW